MIETITLQDKYSDGSIINRNVFCEVESVSQKEFFEASQQGFKPEYKLTLWISDYNNEPIVILNGEAYKIYRSYRCNADRMELYITLKSGVK